MNSAPEEKYWVICPACRQPNPPGRWFCQHCWSPKVRSGETVDDARMHVLLEQQQVSSKRHILIKWAAVSLGSAALAAAVVLSILYVSTDILARPPLSLNSASRPGEWAMFHHDLLHSGALSLEEAAPQGQVAWTFAAGGAIQSSPAVSGGTVYFGSRDGKIYAVDAATGTQKWAYQTGSWVESSPAVVGGVVYCGSNDGHLYALDAATGRELWSFETQYAASSAPAVADGMVYFSAEDYNVYAVDAATGKQVWKFEADELIHSSPTVANGIVYTGAGGCLYAVDARSGKFRLRFDSYAVSYSPPVVSGSTVYLSNLNGSLYAVDGNARSWPIERYARPLWVEMWIFGLAPSPPPISGTMWNMKLGETIHSSPAMVGSTAYLGVDDKLMAVDLQGRQKLWSFGTGGRVDSSPAVAGGTVYVGSNDGRLYAVDAATGQELWHVATGGEVGSSPALADGVLYVGSHDGKLYAIK
jgi:outer membrane protein assembly factor BamB